MGTSTPESLQVLTRTIQKAGLPTSTDFTAEEIFEAVLSDKKRSGGSITLVIPDEVGHCRLEKMEISKAEEYLIRGLDQAQE